MSKFNELAENVVIWAKEKGINDPNKQYLKFLEEIGELAKAVLQNNEAEIKDGIGDVCITMIILFNQTEHDTIRQKHLKHKELDTKLITLYDVVGDVQHNNVNSYAFIFLKLYAEKLGYDFEECLELAWTVIKDRKGKTIDNVFIKDK